MLRIHTIPYKPLSRCNMEELAAHQRWKDGRQVDGGVAFARKDEQEQKDAARLQILELLTLERKPQPISVLSMPGMNWRFEGFLLKQRDPGWLKISEVYHTHLTCVENDRLVYYSASTRIPGKKRRCCIHHLDRPVYGECAIGNKIIDRYIFANVDDLMQDSDESFDVAWLDYTGPLSVDRMQIIEQFWRYQVRDTLIVTSLKARWNKLTSREIAKHGSCLDWLRVKLPGHVVQEIEYQDGASPMVQFAVEKLK